MLTEPDNHYCILLSANTPLFAHVRYAFERGVIPHSVLERVALRFLPDGQDETTVAANDQAVIAAIRRNHYSNRDGDGFSVLAGICDPNPIGHHGTTPDLVVRAAIVKRLGLMLVTDASVELNRYNIISSYISEFRAHGNLDFVLEPGQELTRERNKPSSSAQALAVSLRKAIHGDSRIRIRGCPYASRSTESTKMNDYRLADDAHPQKDVMYITADIITALGLKRKGYANAEPVSSVFPEWSRFLLSGFVTRANMSRDEHELVQNILRGISAVCRWIHYTPTFLDEMLESLYQNESRVLGIVPELARLVREHTLIPDDLAGSRLAHACNEALWDPRLPLAGFMLDNLSAAGGARFQFDIDGAKALARQTMMEALEFPSTLSAVESVHELRNIAIWIRTRFLRYEEYLRARLVAVEHATWRRLATIGIEDVERSDDLARRKEIHRKEANLLPFLEALLTVNFYDVNYKDAWRGDERRPDLVLPQRIGDVWLETKYVRLGQSKTDAAGYVARDVEKLKSLVVGSRARFGLMLLFVDVEVSDSSPAERLAIESKLREWDELLRSTISVSGVIQACCVPVRVLKSMREA